MGRCFNKANPDGTVRVVHFVTMPATSSDYGKFAVEIGVHIPEVWMFLHGSYGARTPKTFTIGDCEVRRSVDPPDTEQGRDQQWEALSHPALITRLKDQLESEAGQFFDRYSDRAAIMQELEKNDASVPWVHDRSTFILAILDAERGADARHSTREQLEAYLTAKRTSPLQHVGHSSYVRALLSRI